MAQATNILQEKRVVCSGCKKTLRIQNRKMELSSQLICPVCKSPVFVSFLADNIQEANAVNSENPTIYSPTHSFKPYIEYNGSKYYIEKDVTVIGRKASTSTADIQLESNDMYMGRHHAAIIKGIDSMGCQSCMLRAQDAKNGLSVNNIELSQSDQVKLLNGAEIKMGNTVVRFRMG